MIDINKIPMPGSMAKRPRDSRGYPIPFFQYLPPNFPQDRKVDFTVTDPVPRLHCLTKRLCGLCGEFILGDVYFIGGPLSFDSGCYSDPGMHRACAEYAIAVCPFLNTPNYNVLAMEVRHKTRTDVFQDAMIATERPPIMYLVKCKTYELTQIKDGHTGKIGPMIYAYVQHPEVVREF